MKAPLIALAAVALVTPALAKAPVLHVSGWARPTVAGQATAAAYLSIHNAGPGADRLLSVSSPVAGSVSVHSTSMAGGVMRMRAAGALPIAAGKRIEMKPGALHVMLTGLRAPLRPGQKLPVALRFEKAGLVRATVPVQMTAPANDGDHHGH